MPMRYIKAGDIVEYDGGEYLVGEVLGNVVRLRNTGTTEYRVVALEEMSDAIAAVPAPPIAHPGELDRLTNDQIKALQYIGDHLEEMITGIHPNLPGIVNPVYRRNVRLADREQAKSDELKKLGQDISPRSLRRKAKRYMPAPGIRDLAALIDLRTTKQFDPVEKIPDHFLAAITAVMKASNRTMTLRGNKDDLVAELDRLFGDEDYAMPTDATLRKWINAVKSGKFLQRSAKHRGSVNKRGDWMFNSRKAVMPGQEVQVDSSPFDILVRDERDNTYRAMLAAMIDKRTRTIVASGVFDRSTKGIDLTVLLARALAPRRVRRTANRLQHLNLPVMPWTKDLTDEDRVDYDDRVPFIYPQRLIMDNGADWRSKVFMSGCARFGIDVTIAPPGSPTWKAIIEHFFAVAMQLFAERLPGFISRDPSHRGRKEWPVESLLTIDELSELWDEWIVVAWQNRKHEGLVDPQTRSRRMTPNQMYLATYDVSAPIALPITRDDYIGLMPVWYRTVQPDGITIGTRRYDHPRLREFVGRKSTEVFHEGEWPVRYDPYDVSAVWFQDPATGEWIECDWMNQRWVGEPHQEFIRKQLVRIQRTTPALDNDAASAIVLDALRVFAPNVAHAHKLKRRRNRAMVERAKSGMPELRERSASKPAAAGGTSSKSSGAGFIELPGFDAEGDQ